MEPSHNYDMGGSIPTWYFRVFLVRSRYYSVIIGGSDTINGVSGRFRYVLPYLRVFLVGSRSYSVIMGGSHPGDSGIMGKAAHYSRPISNAQRTLRDSSTQSAAQSCGEAADFKELTAAWSVAAVCTLANLHQQYGIQTSHAIFCVSFGRPANGQLSF